MVLRAEERLTIEEATDYLFKHVLIKDGMMYFHDRLINDIIELDCLYNEPLQVIMPEVLAVADKKGDLYIKYQDSIKIKHVQLEYSIKLDDLIYKDFMPKLDPVPYILIGTGGIIIGLVVGLLVN